MSTHASRIRRARAVDTIGVLAVVLGLMLGLVPGIEIAPAWAAVSVDIDQCRNDLDNDDVKNDCAWVNGNLNRQNSIFAEGESVPFRVRMTGLTTGASYELPINYDILNSGFVAYDTLTSWNRTETGDPLVGTGLSGAAAMAAIPQDPHADAHGITPAVPAEMSLWGGTWDATTPVTYTSGTGTLPTASNASVTSELRLRFTATGPSVVLAWGGHIALRQDWNPKGFTTGPQDTNGSPYHMRIGDKLGTDLTGGTDYTLSNLGNQDRSLKANAVILPGGLDIIKKDADGNFLENFSFEVYDDADQKVAECTTGADGICRVLDLPVGDYTVKEVDAPDGYLINATVKPAPISESATYEVEFVNERADYAISVEPDGRNAVGNDHTFTVTLTREGSPLAGATISLAWSPDGAPGSITDVNGGGAATSCTTRAENDATTELEAGTCVVTVTSSSPGDGTLTATYDTPYQHDDGTGDGGASTGGDLYDTISDSADKTWVGYVAKVAATATNLVSHGDGGTQGQHVFTVTVKEDDGSGSLSLPGSSVDVTVTWTNAPTGATITDSDAAGASDLVCSTALANGTCTFTVDSPTSGAGTITIVGLDGTILGLDAADGDESLTYSSVTDAPDPVVEPGEGNSLTATKTWREYRATISGDAVNPVGQPHTFDVQVQYSEDDGTTWTDAAILGMKVDWDSAGDGRDVDVDETGIVGSTCDDGTLADGSCTIVVTTGAAEPGVRTVTLLSVTGNLLPNDNPDVTDLTYTFDSGQYADGANQGSTKTWQELGANIVADGHNLVGDSHTFTVTVWRKPTPGSGESAVPEDTKVTTTVDWDSDEPEPTNLVTDNDCLDNGTTTTSTPDGLLSTCTITLNSSVPGKATVTVTGLEGYDFGDGNGSQPVTFSDANQDSADKTWYRYRAWIDADSTNLAGDPQGDHDFNVFVQQDSGDGWGPVPTDTTVKVTSPDATNDGTLDDASCTTTTDGDVSTCTIGVSSLTPGSRTVTVSEVQALDVDKVNNEHPWVDVSGGEYLDDDWATTYEPPDDSPTEATKTWVRYSATISDDAINLTGEDHVFTVNAFVDSGNGPEPAPAGTKLTVDVENAFLVIDTCKDGTGNQDDLTTEAVDQAADNECYVVVTSSDVGSVTVTVTHATPGAGIVDNNPTDDITDVAATKDWIEIEVDVDPTATNIAGDSHTFDIDVTVNAPGQLADWELDSVVVSPTGDGQVDTDTCFDPADDAQSCAVTVSSNAPGTMDVEVTYVAFTYDGESFEVDFAAENSTVGEGDEQDLTASKTWRAYRATIYDDGFNLVRDAHPFTVKVEYTDDGQNWSDAPDVDVTVGKQSGTGTVTVGECTTDAQGTCGVEVDSSVAGTGTFEVTSITVDDPGTVIVDERTLGDGHVAFDNSDTADKTWAAFRASIDDDSLNEVGDEHMFIVSAEYTVDGTNWFDVPDGSIINVSTSGDAGEIIDDAPTFDTTCEAGVSGDGEGTTNGDCVVWVDSSTSGFIKVTVDSIDPTTDLTLTEDFGTVTLLGGESGVLESTETFPSDDYEATKTWASYELELPPDAINLLDGSAEDPERFHEVEVKLHSTNGLVAPVGGQDIAVTLSDHGTITAAIPGSVDSDTTATCTTGAVTPAAGPQTGTCTVTIFADSPGVGEVDATYTTVLGDSGEITVTADADLEAEGDQGHRKTWTTFQVDIDPRTDENIVGNWHLFTITVEESDLEGGFDPVVGVSSPDDLSFQFNGTDLTTSTDGTVEGDPDSLVPYCDAGTDDDGKCVVAVKSDTVQAITVVATYTESYENYSSGTGDAVFDSPDGAKEWIDYAISMTPPTADNLINTVHTMTVTVSKATAASEAEYLGLPGVFPDVEVLSGPGTIIGGTCVDLEGGGTDSNGECTVELRSSETGLTTIGASYEGTNASQTESKVVDVEVTKLWWDYELVLTPAEATNAVGDDHTFTATLTVDTGEGFGPAAGETLTFTVEGVGSVIGGDVDGDLECTTDEAGQCDIVINSDEGGQTDVGVSYGAEVGETSGTFADDAVKFWVDIDLVKTAVVGDGFSDGDLVEDPSTGLPTLFFTSSDQGPKTAVFEYLITNTGGNDLFDLALVDDRLGGIDLATQSNCPDVLAVGESCTARASEQFTYQDAAGGLNNIITNVGLVTASGDDGSEVSDTDDAVIQLIAQQSSILIDLVKSVVAGAGDVEDFDGIPTVTWSEDEVNANASKVVRYSFTVTNVGPSPIVDVELVDPMISDEPLIAVSDGVTLQPGESTVVEVDYLLTADQAFPDGPIAGEVPNVATVSGANETRDSFDEDTDDAIVFVQVVFAEVEERILPATGLTNGGLLPTSLLLISVGLAILWLDRRRATIR